MLGHRKGSERDCLRKNSRLRANRGRRTVGDSNDTPQKENHNQGGGLFALRLGRALDEYQIQNERHYDDCGVEYLYDQQRTQRNLITFLSFQLNVTSARNDAHMCTCVYTMQQPATRTLSVQLQNGAVGYTLNLRLGAFLFGSVACEVEQPSAVNIEWLIVSGDCFHDASIVFGCKRMTSGTIWHNDVRQVES